MKLKGWKPLRVLWKYCHLEEPDPFGELIVAGGHGPHDDVGVAVHVLRQRVVADVGTQLQRTLLKKGKTQLKFTSNFFCK